MSEYFTYRYRFYRTEDVLSLLTATRAVKPAVVFPENFGKEVLLPTSRKLGKVLFTSHVADVQNASLGTMIFAYRASQNCATKRVFKEREEILNTKSNLLPAALLGSFEFAGRLKEAYTRFRKMKFSALAVYLPEESASAFFEHFLREQGYLDILALPLIATQLRILEQARKNLYKKYQEQKVASLDPAFADKDTITSEYLRILHRHAADERKILVVSQNEARWISFSLAKLKSSGLLDILTEPYKRSVRDVLIKDPSTIAKELKNMIDGKVFYCGRNLMRQTRSNSVKMKKPAAYTQLDLFK